MKTRTTLLCLLLVVSSPVTVPAGTRTVSTGSTIVSVTVFADRAQVTRSAALSLEAGTNLVTLDGLPQLMAEESLRVQGKGTGPARISGVTVKNVFLERIQEKRVLELEEQIAAVNRKVESIEAQRKALIAQKAFIESIRVGWGERISKEIAIGKPTAAEMGDAAKFVGEGIGKIEEQLYDAEAARKPLLNRIAALKKELEQNRADRMKEVRSVQVAVEADRKMAFSLDLSYLVSQAGWEPSYDVRLGADGREAELVYRAHVWQKSGEDWPGVKLALSTARPEVGGAPPELTPWHVSLYEPPRPLPYPRTFKGAQELTTMPPGLGAQPPGAPAPAAEQMEGALPVPAQVAQGQTSVLFNVRAPVDIPGDGTRSDSIIAIEKVPVTAEFVTVPKLSPRVYLKSEVTNDTVYPLLAGEINVFNDAVFTGKVYLKTISSGEKFDLYFGADDQIKVKRDVAKVRKKAGLLGSNSVSYRTTVELENFKKTPVKVSLLDQLPLPGNAEIKVNLEEASPRPDETRQDGTLVWKATLAPGEKRKISCDIVIEYPKGRDLVGVE
ncbi:MAG: hypothetical protein A2075_23505 [Geobacteraceae bacterium GWC2_58_44]|nr:MAG: hypothetical protein A2075_23505 [Geobacteraceae bacterium GWC2_58_44]HBG07597.1 hypothetical protein [Geobacter sp.]